MSISWGAVRLKCKAGAEITMMVSFGTGIFVVLPAEFDAVRIVSSELRLGIAGT